MVDLKCQCSRSSLYIILVQSCDGIHLYVRNFFCLDNEMRILITFVVGHLYLLKQNSTQSCQ